MYEELVERLRSHNGWALNKTLDEAADAIEGLSGLVGHYGGETGIKNLEEYASKYLDLLKNTPRRFTDVIMCRNELKREAKE